MIKTIPGEAAKHRCSYRNCSNGPYQNGKKLFRFPKQFDRLHVWLANCGNKRLENLAFETIIRYGICEDHFPDSAFRSADKSSIHRESIPLPFNVVPVASSTVTRDIAVDGAAIPVERLRRDAGENNPLPLLDHDYIATVHEPTVTAPRSVSQTHETCNVKLHAEIEKLKKENLKLRGELKMSNKILNRYRRRHDKCKLNKDAEETCKSTSRRIVANRKRIFMSLLNKMSLAPAAKAMISLQLHTNKAPYSDEEMNLAKQLHYYSPAALRRLRKAGCNFPSPATLNRWVEVSIDLLRAQTPAILVA